MFKAHAIVLAIVIPILIPVKEPGPLTTIILSRSFGVISASSNNSIILGKASLDKSFSYFFLIEETNLSSTTIPLYR